MHPVQPRRGLSTAKFQKKLVVFNDSFTADRNIVVRGLLPPILVDASETDVRHGICEVIRSCSDFDNCGPNDFQFIDMNGKQASVPKCKSGFVWDGRAVKELIGCGSLYVRLIDDIGVLADASSSSSDEHNLPHITVIGLGNTDEVDDPRTHASDKSPVSGHPSHSNSANVPFTLAVSIPSTFSNIMSSDNEDVTSNHASGSPGLRITYKKPYEGQELAQLAELFPAISADRLKYVYAVSKWKKFDHAVECLMEGPSLESLQALLAMQLIVPLSESPNIRIEVDADEEEMVGAALAYYKQERFNKEAAVRINMRRQPGIDTGGIRRQFFPLFLEILHYHTLCRYLMVQFKGSAHLSRQVIYHLDFCLRLGL